MDITSPGLIERAARKCLGDKWRRESVHELLAAFCEYTPRQIAEHVKQDEKYMLNEAIENLAKWLAERFERRDMSLPPIHQFTARDRSSGKVRDYCEETMVQQICDYVAVEALMPLFIAKLGAHQCASLKERGQKYGQRYLVRWMRRDPKGTRTAIKADVRKAFPSTDKKRLKELLSRDVKNEALLWLVFLLLDSMPKGLSIGSYLSMFLFNYMMSYAWRYITQLRQAGKRLAAHVMTYMDDVTMYGRAKRDIMRAFRAFCLYLRIVLGFRVKRAWRHYRAHFIDKSGRSRGAFTDMMGVRVYRDRTTLRRRIFLRTRATYGKMDRRTRGKRPIPKKLAGRAVSYNGWLINTDMRQWMKRHVFKHGLAKRAKSTISYYAKKERDKYGTENRGFVCA